MFDLNNQHLIQSIPNVMNNPVSAHADAIKIRLTFQLNRSGRTWSAGKRIDVTLEAVLDQRWQPAELSFSRRREGD
jgi:hypothetical protein